jgi:hypothetical protein
MAVQPGLVGFRNWPKRARWLLAQEGERPLDDLVLARVEILPVEMRRARIAST